MKSATRLFVPSLTGCLLVASLLSSCTGVHGPMTFPVAEEPQAERPQAEAPQAALSRMEFEQPVRVQYGVASWYGRAFHGRPTASGEVYDMHQSTAAHRKVPLGTYAVVTNLENGQATRVRINDRGPFSRGRIMDLSYGAARQIDMVRRGSARVKVEFLASNAAAAPVLSRPVLAVWQQVAPEPVPAQIPSPTVTLEPGLQPYAVQAGAYQAVANAERAQKILAEVHPQVWITQASEHDSRFHRVRLGPFQDRSQADRIVRAVKARGYAAAVVALAH
ncbi:MAG: septal ring lytic transglycosylase RlpA family protein [Candidatus Tectimicrobiota bacterium]